jgi:hypothetical protein
LPARILIHLVNKVGFAGVHPRKSYLYLNLRTEQAIIHARVVKTEQVSNILRPKGRERIRSAS